jgi:hypothetical protein
MRESVAHPRSEGRFIPLSQLNAGAGAINRLQVWRLERRDARERFDERKSQRRYLTEADANEKRSRPTLLCAGVASVRTTLLKTVSRASTDVLAAKAECNPPVWDQRHFRGCGS